MSTNKNQLISYLSPEEQTLFQNIQTRSEQNRRALPALYRAKKLTSEGLALKEQIEKDLQVLTVLKRKAALRKAKAEHLSSKITEDQYAELKRKFAEHTTT